MKDTRTVIAWAATLVVIGALVAGLWVTDSPNKVRADHRDSERAQDLHAIAYEIRRFTGKDGAMLPASLEEVRNNARRDIRFDDPWTHEPYEYLPSESSEFQLCATFETEGPHEAGPFLGQRQIIPTGHPSILIEPIEGSGRQCFEIGAR